MAAASDVDAAQWLSVEERSERFMRKGAALDLYHEGTESGAIDPNETAKDGDAGSDARTQSARPGPCGPACPLFSQ